MKSQTTVFDKLVKFLRLVLLEICWQLELTYRYLFTGSDNRALELDKNLSSYIKSKGMGNAKIHQIFSNSTLTILTPTNTMYRTTYRQISQPVTQQEEDMLRFVCGKGATSGNQNHYKLKINNDSRTSFKVKRKPRRFSSDFAYSELPNRQIKSKTALWIETR